MSDTHVCKLLDDPPSLVETITGSICMRYYKQSVLIWEKSPLTINTFRTEFQIDAERYRQLTTHPLIIHPCSKFRTYYEFWMIFVISTSVTYFAMFATYRSYDAKSRFHVDIFAYSLLTFFNLIDMLMNFVTGYFENESEVVLDPRKIGKRYLCNKWFFLDVLLFIVTPAYLGGTFVVEATRKFAHPELCFLYILKLHILMKYVKRLCEMTRLSHVVTNYVQCVIVTVLIFHYFACFYFLGSKYRWVYGPHFPETDPNSWLHHMHIRQETPFFTQYITSLYRASASLLAIKRGRFHRPGRVWEESLIEITLYILGKLLMGCMTVLLLEIFLLMNRKEREYQETMTQITGYMCRKNVPEVMQQRVVSYYEYRFNRTVFRESAILEALSSLLIAQFHLHDISTLIKNVYFFAKLSKGSLDCITKNLKSEFFLENDTIIKAGEPGDCMYFILNGTVAVLTPAGEEICHLQDGAYFGEVCLLLKNTMRTATVVSIERCTLYRLDRKALKNCLKDKKVLDELEEVALKRQAEVEDMMSTATAAKLELMHHQ